MVAGRLKVWNEAAGEWEYTPGGDGGGSQAVAHIVLPFAFDTPGILAGLPLYTPAAGEVFVAIWISTTTAWDGTTPSAYISSQGEDQSQSFQQVDLTQEDTNHDAAGHVKTASGTFPVGSVDYFADATPLILTVDDGSTGDPGSTMGVSEAHLLVAAAGS